MRTSQPKPPWLPWPVTMKLTSCSTNPSQVRKVCSSVTTSQCMRRQQCGQVLCRQLPHRAQLLHHPCHLLPRSGLILSTPSPQSFPKHILRRRRRPLSHRHQHSRQTLLEASSLMPSPPYNIALSLDLQGSTRSSLHSLRYPLPSSPQSCQMRSR